MNDRTPNPNLYWHSPARAWTPLMWLIGAVAIAASVMALAPI